MIAREIVRRIEESLNLTLDHGAARPVSGGCIHDAVLIPGEDGALVFVKQNRPAALPLFVGEKASLDLIRSAGVIGVPEPYLIDTAEGVAFFAMEGLELSPDSSAAAQALLGEKLAALHQAGAPDGRFGAAFDNFIGATPQSNRPRHDWADFFIEERLTPQFRLAERRGKSFAAEEKLCTAVHAHLSRLEISPVLLHGDLWGGNAGFLPDGEPVLFDPASYFGDRETDLAFTKLFGGYSPAFYEAYRAVHAEPEPIREVIYNLYHLLNHFNLFGGSYAASAESSIERILRAA